MPNFPSSSSKLLQPFARGAFYVVREVPTTIGDSASTGVELDESTFPGNLIFSLVEYCRVVFVEWIFDITDNCFQ